MRKFGIALVAMTALAVVLVVSPVANAADPVSKPARVALEFPSNTSKVIASDADGFVDGVQVGFFWSTARGDSVEQTFVRTRTITKAVLKLDVVQNNLNSGAHVDWTVSINGKDIGKFQVVQGQFGPITKHFRFATIKGPSYDVKMRVTNEVAGGQGTHTLRYFGDGPHSISLQRK